VFNLLTFGFVATFLIFLEGLSKLRASRARSVGTLLRLPMTMRVLRSWSFKIWFLDFPDLWAFGLMEDLWVIDCFAI